MKRIYLTLSGRRLHLMRCHVLVCSSYLLQACNSMPITKLYRKTEIYRILNLCSNDSVCLIIGESKEKQFPEIKIATNL